ncbi:MAG: twin-arginine translocase subunit TatB [Rhodobacter sp.]|nr:twin-arginine translocase subunit TatB [Paracoccaceae bacterium]MCC0077898.1 twin-arginine translocase subunit TatB [Rhodobacter sp.]
MFDIGWSEMMVIGVVALIVVGPKDLPKMFHTIGQFTGKARGMAREFQRAMDAAARETGVNDIAKDLRKTASGQSFKEAAGFDEIEKQFKSIGRTGPDVRKPATPGQTPVAKSDAADKPGMDDESDADEAAAAGHDADMAARNAELTAVEEERLRKQKRADATRLKAAAIRARKEAEAAQAAADAAEAEAWTPAARTSKDES